MVNVVEIDCYNEADCSAAVGIWNYWDHEHVTVVHHGFKEATILYEDDSVVITRMAMRIPILSFLSTSSLISMYREDDNTLIVCNVMVGLPVVSTIRVTEDRKDRSKYHMNYKFLLVGWRRWLAPLYRWGLRIAVPWWNARQWQEDLPLKLRRQKVLRAGFKDFNGLPQQISDRTYDGPLICKLPIPRLKGSPVDMPITHQTKSNNRKRDA